MICHFRCIPYSLFSDTGAGWTSALLHGTLLWAVRQSRATQDLGDQSDTFARGRFDSLLGWLRQKIFCQGQRFPAARLIEFATGSPPDHRPFLQGLKRKYGELYGIDR